MIKKKRFSPRYFLVGLLSVALLAGVFFAGLKVGDGTWQISFIKPIAANKGLPSSLDYSSVNEVYQTLKNKYDGTLDEQALLNGLKKGLVEAAGDQYTTYLDETSTTAFNEQLTGSFSGIGAELGAENDNIVIIAPISGFPAEQAGLKAGDIITAIDGQDANGLSVEEAVQRIRGEKGTSVKLNVLRGSQEQLEFTIVRDTITIPSVQSKIIDDNIGYIQITRFTEEETATAVKKAAQDFKSQNVKGIVVDLRNNPGGYLNSAVDISGLWLKKGQTIVSEKRGGQVIQTYKAQSDGILVGMPTVVLINEGSASASEIMAGALQDNGAATLVGVKSFGKGSVQEVAKLPGGTTLKVTIARWFTPSDKNIDKEGITPGTNVVLSADDIKAGVDTQLDAAIQAVKG